MDGDFFDTYKQGEMRLLLHERSWMQLIAVPLKT